MDADGKVDLTCPATRSSRPAQPVHPLDRHGGVVLARHAEDSAVRRSGRTGIRRRSQFSVVSTSHRTPRRDPAAACWSTPPDLSTGMGWHLTGP